MTVEALLDTHALLWVLAGAPELPEWLVKEVDDDPSRFGVSDVSMWEIAIKRSTGRLTVPDELPDVVAELGFGTVGITRRQAWAVRTLPLHHRDPFDRLLIVQAQDHRVPIVSRDAAFTAYELDVRW